jgi:hypothetical protein
MDLGQSSIALDSEGSSQVQTVDEKTDKHTADRFVAFLDIMGFKDRVARTHHNKLLAQLTDFNRDIISYIGKYPDTDIQLAQFSDSIVLFSNDTTLKSLKTIAEVTRGIMQVAIKQQIPIKGAIARGQITYDISKQLFFGQALIDAYLLEENIHYYGILVHHTAEADILNLGTTSIFKDVKAPLRSGNISHYELSWYVDNLSDKKLLDLNEVSVALKNIRQAVSDAPRKYIDNTLDVITKYYMIEDE